MRTVHLAIVLAALGFGSNHAFATMSAEPMIESEVVEHGGGCRKSSPPGQCCHMDRKAGVVHCH